jgi:predicted deacylase
MINNHPLLMIITGNIKSKKVICFSAGIHGNESSGPLAIIDFLNQYQATNNDPKIIIFPVANPVGFNDNTYFVRDGQNLNRNFGKRKMTAENHLLYTAIMNEPISFFASFHEDDELAGAYMHAYFDEKKPPAIYFDLLDTLSKTCPIYKKNRIHNYKAKNGLVPNPAPDGSFEDQMRQDGVKYSICLEIPDRLPIGDRIEANTAIMKTIVDFIKKEKI